MTLGSSEAKRYENISEVRESWRGTAWHSGRRSATEPDHGREAEIVEAERKGGGRYAVDHGILSILALLEK